MSLCTSISGSSRAVVEILGLYMLYMPGLFCESCYFITRPSIPALVDQFLFAKLWWGNMNLDLEKIFVGYLTWPCLWSRDETAIHAIFMCCNFFIRMWDAALCHVEEKSLIKSLRNSNRLARTKWWRKLVKWCRWVAYGILRFNLWDEQSQDGKASTSN